MTGIKRLVVLISGRGSNLSAIANACGNGTINGTVVGVISNKENAAGLKLAADAGIATMVIDHRAFASRENFDSELLRGVSTFAPDFVVLAGFMRILTPVFVRPMTGKLINIHPSLLPRYPGLDTHRRAIESGDLESGATVHFVTENLDAGPGIIQVKVPVLAGDTEAELAARILDEEHRIYVEALRLLCRDRVVFKAPDKALLDGEPLPRSGLVVRP